METEDIDIIDKEFNDALKMVNYVENMFKFSISMKKRKRSR